MALLAIAAATPAVAKSPLSDAQVRPKIIKQSIASYPGNCPYPYNAVRNGSSCGGRSAWSRAGGYAPLCYPKDVSRAAVAEWRASH